MDQSYSPEARMPSTSLATLSCAIALTGTLFFTIACSSGGSTPDTTPTTDSTDTINSGNIGAAIEATEEVVENTENVEAVDPVETPQAVDTTEQTDPVDPPETTETEETTETIEPTDPTPTQTDTVSDSFDGNGPLLGYSTNNAASLPDVVRSNGRYQATLLNNDSNITLHFHEAQGRLDAKRITFPFEYIVRNIGIGTLKDSQVSPQPDDYSSSSNVFMFAGIQVHALDFELRDSAHFVVGHRGATSFTVEGKNTVNGRSRVNDAGQGIVPNGRADLRVVGSANGTLTWYWQQPNNEPGVQADDWIAYRGNGDFPGEQAHFGEEVYIGLITYAYGSSNVGFLGTADSIELVADGP